MIRVFIVTVVQILDVFLSQSSSFQEYVDSKNRLNGVLTLEEELSRSKRHVILILISDLLSITHDYETIKLQMKRTLPS